MRSDSGYQFASDEKNLRPGAEVYLKGYKSVLARPLQSMLTLFLPAKKVTLKTKYGQNQPMHK